MWLLLPLVTVTYTAGVAIGLICLAGATLDPLCAALAWVPVAGAIPLIRRPPLAALALAAGAALIGLVAGAGAATDEPTTLPFTGEVELLVDVVEGARPALSEHSFEARIIGWRRGNDWRPCDARARVWAEGASWLPATGDRLRFRGVVRAPRERLHRFTSSPVRSAQLAGRDVNVIALTEPILVGVAPGPRRALDRARLRLERAIFSSVPRRRAAVLVAITTGSRGAIDEADRDRFRGNGAAHVLAVSGLHLGLLGLGFHRLVRGLLRRVRLVTAGVGADRAAAAMTLPAVAAYVVLTGAPASAVRAGVMAGIVLIGALAGRPGAAGHALCAAVLGMLLLRPLWLADFGFQLSVTATSALVAMSALGRGSPFSAETSWWGRVVASLQASTVASLATAPALLWHTGVFPIVGPLTNLVVVPPIALVSLPLSAIGGTATALGAPGGGALLTLAGWATGAALWVAESAEPVLSIGLVWGRPGGLALAGWILAAMSAPALGQASLRAHAVVTVAIGLMLLAAPPRWLAPEPHFEVHAIPVGQGDCSLVLLPGGTTLLIDAGGSQRTPGPGAHSVLPYLRGLGIARIDGLVATHADIDHIGGLFEVVAQVRPRWVWMPDRDDESLDRLAASATSVGAVVQRIGAMGRHQRAGETGFDLLTAVGGSDNDAGLVLRVCHGPVCALFPGDIETGREQDLVSSGISLEAGLLSVPHHGSRTSSTAEFLETVAPRVAIVHVGAGNRFGFPHPGPIARLRALRVSVRRTDAGEAVVYRSDGIRGWLAR